MKQILTFSILIVLVASSCKKDHLDGERTILIGNWEWVYSKKFTNYNSPPFTSTVETVSPSNVSSTYGLEFLAKGKIRLIENGEVKIEYRTVFSAFASGGNCLGIVDTPFDFTIDLDNKDENYLNGCVSVDSLVLFYKDFPFATEENGNYTITYWHYFKKVQ